MPLYRISGKFADNHTFSTTVDGEDAGQALASFQAFDDVKNYKGGAVTQVNVVQQVGKSRIRISDEPAKPRKPREKKVKPAASAVPAPNANTGKTQPAGRR